VVEDAPARLDERALFHLLNLVREEEAILLITRVGARDLGRRLPDLASRLRAIPVGALSAPDDALLRAVMVKLFADRQLASTRA
jgi:chromosomal replication initiation ATPase DnaA